MHAAMIILSYSQQRNTYSIKIRQLINLQESLTKNNFWTCFHTFFSLFEVHRYEYLSYFVCNFHIMKVSKHTAIDPKEADKFYYVLKSKNDLTGNIIGVFEKSIQLSPYRECVFLYLQYKNFSRKRIFKTTVILVHLVTRTSLWLYGNTYSIYIVERKSYNMNSTLSI